MESFESEPAPKQQEPRAHEGAALSQSRVADQNVGAMDHVFGGASGDENGIVARLLETSSISHSVNGAVRAFALKRVQQTHGNRFVQGALAGYLRRQPQAPPAPAPPISAPVESWSMKIEKGGEGKDLPRPMDADRTKLFKGDKSTVTVKFSQPAKDNNGGGISATPSDERLSLKDLGWKDDQTYAWEMIFSRVGQMSALFEAGQPRQTHSEQFTVVADLQDFAFACIQAQARILERFNGAAEQLNQAARAFRQAQAQQDADLKEVAEGEKMVDDLLWGVLFAAAGGTAGGAVGGWIKTVKEGAFAKQDWLIDTGKDIAKFAVRSLDKIRGGTQKTAGDSTSPSKDDPTAKRGGERSAAGENPFDFLTTLSEQVAGEGRKAHGKLADLISDARAARDANSKADFEDDPVSVVNGGVNLANIEGIETNKNQYLKGLWKAWLGAYAWKVVPGPGIAPGGYHAESQVNRKIYNKIEKVAKSCGENADDWIREFGLPARQRAEEEAAKKPHGPFPWD